MTKKLFNPEIIRIKLTPEQAVLTCCDSSAKGQVIATQCSVPSCSGAGASAISS